MDSGTQDNNGYVEKIPLGLLIVRYLNSDDIFGALHGHSPSH